MGRSEARKKISDPESCSCALHPYAICKNLWPLAIHFEPARKTFPLCEALQYLVLRFAAHESNYCSTRGIYVGVGAFAVNAESSALVSGPVFGKVHHEEY